MTAGCSDDDDEMEEADGSEDFDIDAVEDDSEGETLPPPRNVVHMLPVRACATAPHTAPFNENTASSAKATSAARSILTVQQGMASENDGSSRSGVVRLSDVLHARARMLHLLNDCQNLCSQAPDPMLDPQHAS